MSNISIMCVPCGFKIKKKIDIEYFIEKCMQKDDEYYFKINNELAVFIRKYKNGCVSVLIKNGDLNDIFNPLLEVANTNNSAYKETVYDYIWKYRKYINAKWFNE